MQEWGNGTQYSGRIWQINSDGSELEMLNLPNLDRCERNGFDADSVLPNNTLPSSQIGTGGYSWHPDMTHGITSDGNGRTLEEQMYWFRPDGYEFIDLGFPQAWGPQFRPDGGQIAFFAAPEQGREGIDRLDSVYNLYLMNPDESDVRPLVKNLRHPEGLAWSPDGRWIAYSAELARNSRQDGIWLADAETGESTLLVRGSYGRPSWSPDGKQMVVVEFSDDFSNDPTNHLAIIDMHWP